MCKTAGYDDTAEKDLWLLWCHVWESEYRRYKKAWRSLSCGGLLSSRKNPEGARARVCLRVHMRPSVSLCVPVCVRVCSGADDRGRDLHTRGTANEKEAFPLTFHGSQKQFTQWKVAKQPQCFSTESGKRKEATQILDLPPQASCIGKETKRKYKRTKHDSLLKIWILELNSDVKINLPALKLSCTGRNKFIFHASSALWLLLIEDTEWFPTSLACTHTMPAVTTWQIVKWPLPCIPTLNMSNWVGQADLKSKHRQSAGHMRAPHYPWHFNRCRAWTPVGRSHWHNIRSSEMQSRYAMLIPLQTRHYCPACLLWTLVEDSVFTFVHTALRSGLLGQVQRTEDVPQNTPYLGRGKKQTMTSGWCRGTMTVIWGHNKWLWGMINCYCVGHVCFTEAVQLLHVLYPLILI